MAIWRCACGLCEHVRACPKVSSGLPPEAVAAVAVVGVVVVGVVVVVVVVWRAVAAWLRTDFPFFFLIINSAPSPDQGPCEHNRSTNETRCLVVARSQSHCGSFLSSARASTEAYLGAGCAAAAFVSLRSFGVLL